MSYLILAQSEVTARALGAWLELLGERPLQVQTEDKRLADDRCIVVEQLARNGDQGVDAFETVVDWITKAMAESAPLPLTVLVDTVKSDSLDPLGEGDNWDSLLAMLILAVPDVRWVFGVLSGSRPKWVDESDWSNNEMDEKKTLPNWADWHSLPTLLSKPWRNPLLDPTGLRNHVRLTAKEIRKDRPQDLSLRTAKAAAIDEEVHYALFHAYTAFRFGYRTDAVTSWQLMKELFDETKNTDKPHGFHLLLEDVNLYFPDRPTETHLSSFEKSRAINCWSLGYGADRLTGNGKPVEDSTFRIMVTSGHSGASPEKMEANKVFLKQNKANHWGFVLKPTGGMFDLWAKARLFERMPPDNDLKTGGSRFGLAPGYEWPPKDKKSVADGSGNHSAPGKLMLVASHLVRRADALRDNANTVEECIRGAVLATEAVELLSYRTPTLALQALELKQWFETKAEVAFVGVGHHFQLKRRFKEIERETRVAARFHHKSRRDAAALDAAVTIANRLTLVFREAGQFDEEEECLRKLRWWNRKLSFRRAKNPVHWFGLGLLAYAEWLISSLGWLLLSVIVWLLVIGLLWLLLAPGYAWQEAVKGAIGSFISSNVEITDKNPLIVILSTFSALLGFFHLGVFVSFLYSAIARK
jgi:hypothetical protein